MKKSRAAFFGRLLFHVGLTWNRASFKPIYGPTADESL